MLRKLLYILPILLAMLFTDVVAQNFYLGNANPVIYKAKEDIDYGDFLSARKALEQELKRDSTNSEVLYLLGLTYFNVKSEQLLSLPYFERSAAASFYEAYFYLGKLYLLNEEFDKALKFLGAYKEYYGAREHNDEEVTRLMDKVLVAQLLSSNPNPVAVENLGPRLNSTYSDYVPLVSADDKRLIFTSRRKVSDKSPVDAYGQPFEDIYVSDFINDTWSDPKPLSSNVNSETHDACVSLTPEGERLVLYRTSKKLNSGDLYVTSFDGKEWSVPALMGKHINDKQSVESSACYSPDGDMIIFSSNREGGFGGKDLYRIVKLPNGEWSKALNLGPLINTPYDEDAPFLHLDEKTLYFSSAGHKNMGGFDVFKCELTENGTWTVPMNMGFPLNSSSDDIFFTLDGGGVHGYLSSNRKGGFGQMDNYKVTFQLEEENSRQFVIVYVTDENGKPLHAKISLIDEERGKVGGVYRTNERTGKGVLLKDETSKFYVLVEVDGYLLTKIELSEVERNNNIKLKKN